MTRWMTVLVGVVLFTACETEEEIQMWEEALAESSQARNSFENLENEEGYNDELPLDCAQRFNADFDSGLSERRAPALLPAKGDLACGQYNDIYTNGTDRKKVCTVEYENECGRNSKITGGISGPHHLSTTQNGGTADIDIDVAPGRTLTFNCNGSSLDPDSKCSYKSSCKDAPIVVVKQDNKAYAEL